MSEKFEKDFYEEHPSVTLRSQEDIDTFYKEHGITMVGTDIPRPVFDFKEVHFPGSIKQKLEVEGWSQPTLIQSVGWPLALSGKDMIGIAQTGSGKTLGFTLPAIVHIKGQKTTGDPVCVVLVPTRELAQQVNKVAVQFGSRSKVRSVAVYGGSQKDLQIRQLRKGCDICVATPGRMIDLMQSGELSLRHVTYLVLDEADRMLDMGFEPQIREIISQIRPDRQTLMWSATWPREVRSLARDFLVDPIQVNIGSTELKANPNIRQIVEICEPREKLKRMMSVLKDNIATQKENKTLVFVTRKSHADVIARKIESVGIYADSIHGDKSQAQRDRIMKDFREGYTNVLVATDVASRGLDVSDISFVINLDFPTCIEDYVHRIGRTARAENTGTAYTFITEEDASHVNELVKILRDANQEISPDLSELQASFRSRTQRTRKPLGYSNPRWGSTPNKKYRTGYSGSYRVNRLH